MRTSLLHLLQDIYPGLYDLTLVGFTAIPIKSAFELNIGSSIHPSIKITHLNSLFFLKKRQVLIHYQKVGIKHVKFVAVFC